MIVLNNIFALFQYLRSSELSVNAPTISITEKYHCCSSSFQTERILADWNNFILFIFISHFQKFSLQSAFCRRSLLLYAFCFLFQLQQINSICLRCFKGFATSVECFISKTSMGFCFIHGYFSVRLKQRYTVI